MKQKHDKDDKIGVNKEHKEKNYRIREKEQQKKTERSEIEKEKTHYNMSGRLKEENERK